MRTSPLPVLLALLVVPAPASTLEVKAPGAVSLPAPRTDGKVSVEAALKTRRSVRSFAPDPLTLEEIGQLCWAAQGVTDEKGHRTAPSARAVYPLELHVLAGAVTGLPPGHYRYRPASHSLELVAAGDRRAELDREAVGQPWIATAPAVLVLSGRPAKLGGGDDARERERAARFTWVEAGLAAQGFFLEATAMGLGSTYVGGFRPAETRAVLGLPAGEEPLAVLPVGRRP